MACRHGNNTVLAPGSRNRGRLTLDSSTYAEDIISPEDDHRANRTLFLGNLDAMVMENYLCRAFDRFSLITEVDIKWPTRVQNSTYGFLKFQNLDMAHRAKVSIAGRVVGCSPIKIGYGKATSTTRLWADDLGPWVPLATLAREFDRFGTVKTVHYRKAEPWAYIQYESLDAAQAACVHMRGFPLGGPNRCLRVDFAGAEQRNLQPFPHYELLPEPLLPCGGVRDRTPPSLHLSDALLFPADWPTMPRAGGMGGAVLERECSTQRAWTLRHELQVHDPLQKHQTANRLPERDEGVRRHPRNLPEHSSGSSGQTRDCEWLLHVDRMSPGRHLHLSLVLACEGKHGTSDDTG
uniref:RRM domain-containing protein n=1 Tax=Electrophorus electricus TaxID=8005 RepID=A0A4W4H286_ELEEL